MKSDLILGVTGHRLDKLYSCNKPTQVIKDRLDRFAVTTLKKFNPCKVLSGMEPTGWDMAVTKACIVLNIPLVAVIPFHGHEYPYKKLLEDNERLIEVVFVSPGGYAGWKMQKRNEFIVDNCTVLVALLDQSKSGGTTNTWNYANKVEVESVSVWDEWVKTISAK